MITSLSAVASRRHRRALAAVVTHEQCRRPRLWHQLRPVGPARAAGDNAIQLSRRDTLRCRRIQQLRLQLYQLLKEIVVGHVRPAGIGAIRGARAGR